jgi:formate hydrogenlyase subunit 3/multisubunit Na+/H+ antiporter MnhD subunit
MVSPVILIAAALGFAFLYPLIEKAGRRTAAIAGVVLLGAFAAQSAAWFIAMMADGAPVISQTAGFNAPLSINLLVGQPEAMVLTAVNLIAMLALAYQAFASSSVKEDRWHGRQVVLFFVMVLGANGLVMTRDLFNVFVFMEISSIALYGLLATSRDVRSYEAGFKYMIAGGLASTFYLIGVAFIYRFTGTLNIDSMMMAGPASAFAGISGLMAMVFFVSGILVELKPVFANGWAVDTYEAADPGVGAMLSAITTSAMLMVLIKVLPLIAAAVPALLQVLVLVGALSFVVSSLMALNQTSVRRMLGFSSIAQTGLIILILGHFAGLPGAGGAAVLYAVYLIINHALAKAGLFWVAGLLGNRESRSPSGRRERTGLLIIAGIAVAALIGLPPFPSFWVKWDVLQQLTAEADWLLISVILGGSLLEAAYLFKWFISLSRSSADNGDVLAEQVPGDFESVSASDAVSADAASGGAGAVIPAAAVTALGALSLYMAVGTVSFWVLMPLAALAVFALLDVLRIPSKIQVVLAIAAIGVMGWYTVPKLNGLPLVFMLMFLGGTAVQLLAFYTRKGVSGGLMALITGLTASLAALILAQNGLELFFAWEMMTVTSFLLILRGRQASAASLRYIMFSLVSAYALLAGLQMLLSGTGGGTVNPQAVAGNLWMMAFAAAGIRSAVPAVLIAVAALIKLGNIGFHLWLPAGYAEADDDVSALLSSVLSKAGIFLLILTGGIMVVQLVPALGETGFNGIPLNSILGWIGAVTAVAGAMMALFQEDIKYTLAYSSMGQVGYMVLALATMTHLGYVTGLYLSITHLMFKAMLWLAVLGVIQRTGTRLMYKMGGLIKTMPFSFLVVLFGIIAVSGVPPLSGFGGKWLLYTSLLEKGWYLQAAMAMFASGVAFLYLYRLIHSIFLGQPKDELAHVKEAPVMQLIPQFVFMAGIMAVSMYPNILLKPLQAAVEPLFASTVDWNGFEVISSLGYWNGNAVMYVTMGVFAFPLILLIAGNAFRKVQKVKQFNIVYAAERPYKPETTHYAFNFFAHYQKALGFLVSPWATRFWTGLTNSVSTVGESLRRWNTGNPQTYGFQILLYLLLVFFVTRGGM